MRELISVIVPVYNVRDYLADCVKSITSQSYKNLEILLIDDGSTDGSGELCEKLAASDNRITVIHQKNGGAAAARNTGIMSCCGELLGFFDADDWCEKDFYQIMKERLDESGADVVMCGYVDYPYGPDQPIVRGQMDLEEGSFEETAEQIIRRNGFNTGVCNKLFRRRILFHNDQLTLMDTSLFIGEDEVWLYEILQRCSRIAFVSQPLYFWRPREESLTRSKQLTAKEMSHMEAKKRSFALLPQQKSIQILARGEAFDVCHRLKTKAYLSGKEDWYKIITDFICPMKKDWLVTHDIRVIRKLKVCLLDICMGIKMNKRVVNTINKMR